MSDVLQKICVEKRRYVEAQKKKVPLAELESRIKTVSPVRGFLNALRTKSDAGKTAVISEIKRASPSRGLIREGLDPAAIAKLYEQHGASCISVLTDQPYFQGSDEDLIGARAAVSLPILRKDFMLDTYQIVESRSIGADAILLIMAALTDDEAAMLEDKAMEFGMDVLVEVHDEEELQRALKLKTKLLGINNRNLKTLEVNLRVTETLAANLPKDYLLVAESGISSIDDVNNLKEYGAKAFLVGETLMRAEDPGKELSKLLM